MVTKAVFIWSKIRWIVITI